MRLERHKACFQGVLWKWLCGDGLSSTEILANAVLCPTIVRHCVGAWESDVDALERRKCHICGALGSPFSCPCDGLRLSNRRTERRRILR